MLANASKLDAGKLPEAPFQHVADKHVDLFDAPVLKRIGCHEALLEGLKTKQLICCYASNVAPNDSTTPGDGAAEIAWMLSDFCDALTLF